MAKALEVKKMPLSTDMDFVQLEVFLNSTDTIEFICACEGGVLVVYRNK